MNRFEFTSGITVSKTPKSPSLSAILVDIDYLYDHYDKPNAGLKTIIKRQLQYHVDDKEMAAACLLIDRALSSRAGVGILATQIREQLQGGSNER